MFMGGKKTGKYMFCDKLVHGVLQGSVVGPLICITSSGSKNCKAKTQQFLYLTYLSKTLCWCVCLCVCVLQ